MSDEMDFNRLAQEAAWGDGANGFETNGSRHSVTGDPDHVRIIAEPIDLRLPSGRTDIANAIRFSKAHGTNVRWCEPWGKWLVWDGKRWKVDETKKVEQLAKQVASDVWKAVGVIMPDADSTTGRWLTNFARHTASARGINNMLSLAKSEPGVSVLPDSLDRQPSLLNVLNGTLDLQAGKLRRHDRSDLLTKICPVPFDPDASCERWTRAVSTIFDDDCELIGFIQRLLGYALTGTVVEHLLPIFYGGGSNGKGLFIETIMDVLGSDFACKINAEMLMSRPNDRHPTELADLHGKRLVVASETDDGRRLREGFVKEITGGDTLKARRMREDFWQFRPSHTLLLLTNQKPRVHGTDHGIWRRLVLIPFQQRFWDPDRGESGSERLRADKHLRDHLAAEHPGILAWLVEGCLAWQNDGLGQSKVIANATSEYRESQDVLGAFIEDRCVEGAQSSVKASDLYGEYCRWCETTGERAMSQRTFGGVMCGRGIHRRKSNGVWYDGISIVGHEH